MSHFLFRKYPNISPILTNISEYYLVRDEKRPQ